jgi:hypothetical protein
MNAIEFDKRRPELHYYIITTNAKPFLDKSYLFLRKTGHRDIVVQMH